MLPAGSALGDPPEPATRIGSAIADVTGKRSAQMIACATCRAMVGSNFFMGFLPAW
jgi:hypothetical protein